jgi:site-specific recombinase XerD
MRTAHDPRILHQRFMQECEDGTLKRRSKATLANYLWSYLLLLRLFPISHITQLNEELLREFFRRGDRDRQWSPATIAAHRKNLAPFFSWCVTRGVLGSDPLGQIPQPTIPERLPEFYADEDVERLLYHVDMDARTSLTRTRNKAIVGVMLLAGLRRGEALGLRIHDVDFSEEVVRIRAETAKNRRPRVVTMSRKLTELLRSYVVERGQALPETTAFWISDTTHGRFTAHGLKHLFHRLSQRAGFRVAAHKMRHTFATKFYQGSRDIVSLQQIMGHRKINTTMLYTHVLPENTRASIEQNPVNAYF